MEVRDGVLRQNGWRREREVERVRHAAIAISSTIAATAATPVFAVLCLVRDGLVPQQVGGVMLCGLDRLVEWMQLGRPVLAGRQADAVRRQVEELPAAGVRVS